MPELDIETLADAVAERVAQRLRERDDRPLLTIKDMAERLRIGERTVKDLLYPLDRPKIPSFMIGGQRRVAAADFDRYVAAQRNGTD